MEECTELQQQHRHSKMLKVMDLIGNNGREADVDSSGTVNQDQTFGDEASTTTTTTHISCLYPEILAIIFSMLEVRDRGRAAQVCLSWREAAYHRSVWRRCEPKLHLRRANPSLFPSLVRRGIRRVQILSLRRSLRDVIQGLPNLESLDLSGIAQLARLFLSLCRPEVTWLFCHLAFQVATM